MEKLLLGIARKDATPNVGDMLFGYNFKTFSKSVNDNLNITALSFTYGETKAMLLNATVCVIGHSLCAEIRREISKAHGIPFENIWVEAIHNHSGPALGEEADGWVVDHKYYDEIFHPAALAAAAEAVKNPVPVKVGRASGNSYAGINRRQVNLNNTIGLGQNPWGPFNPEMNVVSFKDEEDKVIANIITYGAHATAAGCNFEVTRDWPGVMTDALEEISGGLTVFCNGTMGDSGPRLKNGRTAGDGIAAVKEIGYIAAGDAVRIFNSIEGYKDVSFATYAGKLSLPVKPRVPYEEAVEFLKSDAASGLNAHLNGQRIAFYTKVKESYENGYEEKEFFEIPQTVFRIGDIAFAPAPFELFAEIGFRIDAAVKDLKVVVMSYTNGQMLYLPTEDQILRGGHEVNCFRYSSFQQFANNADYHMVTETIKNVEALER